MMLYNIGEEVQVQHPALGRIHGVVAEQISVFGVRGYRIRVQLTSDGYVVVLARASAVSPINRLAEIKAEVLAAARLGDDRPAANGDAFETRMLNLLAR